jgi:plasmid stabilization system protein ParE
LSRKLSLRVTHRAASEMLDAAEWWAANRPAAPGAVHQELARAFQLISAQPGVGARARNTHLRGVRRVHLSRVRYHLYYRVIAGDIEILAFWHSSRRAEPPL